MFPELPSDATITQVARRNIFDALRVAGVSWCGRLNDVEFLGRIFDLSKMRSNDWRFSDAARDIWQHRINNFDWDDDWVYSDPRFNLLYGPDENFLRFLCEMIHPVVRPDEKEVTGLVRMFNERLAEDDWEIVEQTRLSGKPVFAARRLLEGGGAPVAAAKEVVFTLNADYVTQQITRMESAIQTAPDLAIGTAKEFVETICKTILKERGAECTGKETFPQLVRWTLEHLDLAPEDVPERAKARETIRVLLQNLATISQGLAELRGPFGTGHGKEAEFQGLEVRHARLAVNAASTLGVFLFETHTRWGDASPELPGPKPKRRRS